MLKGHVKAAFVGAASGALVASLAMFFSTGASARSTFESPYGYERTWNAALRFVRVDNGWKITEKDESSGYLLFDYRSPEATKGTPGSLELVRGHEGDDPVSVLVELPKMPQYHEQVVLDAFASKMRREYGDPPVHKHPGDAPDASTDSAAE
jgi:hypothetical protein